MTSGGDSCGMNVAIRSVVRTCAYYQKDCIVIYPAYKGMIECDCVELNARSGNNIINNGGTILKTARSKEFRTKEGREKAFLNLKKHEIDALVVEGAFANHKDIAADRVPILGRIFVAEQYSGTKHLPDYTKPLLVIHSISDATVPISQGRKLFESANEPKAFYQIDSMHVRGPLYYADSISFKIQSMLEK